MRSLPLFHRITGQRVVVLGDGDTATAKRRLVERAGGIPVGEPEAHHARLAFIALEDEREARAAAMRLRGLGLLVNAVDRPELCDFTVPSLLERDPVLLAIGTSGASAGLAKHLRLRLEALLPQGLGRLAAALEGARDAMRARWPDAGARRNALDKALGEGGRLDPLRGHGDDAVTQWLDQPDGQGASGLFELAIASAHPDDLTLRQARLLGMADVIYHDDSIAPAILDRARADAARRPLAQATAAQDMLSIVLKSA